MHGKANLLTLVYLLLLGGINTTWMFQMPLLFDTKVLFNRMNRIKAVSNDPMGDGRTISFDCVDKMFDD